MYKYGFFAVVCIVAYCIALSSCMAQLYIRNNGDYSNSVRSVSLPVDSVK